MEKKNSFGDFMEKMLPVYGLEKSYTEKQVNSIKWNFFWYGWLSACAILLIINQFGIH